MTATSELTATLGQHPDGGTDGHVDGRTLRRTRNRTAVIVALLDMIREGDLHPAAADIANRAGVSHRSIFRYFDDLDDLARTAIDHAFAESRPLSTIPDLGKGTLAARVGALVTARLDLFEFVDGPLRMARLRADTIPSIDEGIAAVAEVFRSQISQHFASELSDVAPHETGALVDAVLVLTSWDAYAIHLRLLYHDRAAIDASWNAALLALFGS
jgi:AcrR family transcriptional regulator